MSKSHRTKEDAALPVQHKFAEDHMHQVVESAPNAMVMINHEGRIVLVNAETENLFGYERDELLSKPVEILVPERFRVKHPDQRNSFFANPTKRSMGAGRDLSGARKDGTEFPVEIGLNPIETSDGLCVLAAIIDITERKHAERVIQQTNEELRQKNEEMEEFVYTVSHDLKSPIVTQIGFIGCIREDLENNDCEQVLDSVNRLERAAQRMERCINDLLELSRIGRVDHERVPNNIQAIVHEIGDNLAGQLKEVGATLEIAEGLPVITSERIRIIEIFENLITNAMKYGCPDDGGIISVGTENHADEIQIYVRDNGPGISTEYHNKIFGLFQRLDAGKREGTGVGLTIVKRIMEQHDGRAWVESTEGQGATFWLAFPKSSLCLNKEK